MTTDQSLKHQSTSVAVSGVKDPRSIARKYQLDLCKKAVEQNIIVYLETGCGKTLVAVLLIQEFGHLIRKPEKRMCIFLAPTVHLVQQQATVIKHFTSFDVGCYTGCSKHLKNPQDWEEEIKQNEVLVMTPQILLYNLEHCFVQMELIALLIMDECHHAQTQNRHPYAQIMKEFYRTCSTIRPRIFGMTASPIIGKGGSSQTHYSRSINSLEKLLDAKICTVEDKDQLEQVVASPKMKIYFYGPVTTHSSNCYKIYYEQLEDLKNKCVSFSKERFKEPSVAKRKVKMLWRVHESLVFCFETLGLWGAKQAAGFHWNDYFDQNDITDTQELENDDCVADLYHAKATALFNSYFTLGHSTAQCLVPEALEEPYFSKKLLLLIRILLSYRGCENLTCIIFVKRIVVARSLAAILGNLPALSFWKCSFLVGLHSRVNNMSRTEARKVVDGFRTGKVNLLVATNVAEEGLDIQACSLVIRFDLPETLSSFIQSRGRARRRQSEYLCLAERENQHDIDLVKHFISGEERMNTEIASRSSTETFQDLKEGRFTVDKTGASISAGSSVSLVHHYCSKLPRDGQFLPKPEFMFLDDPNGTICVLNLPPSAPVHHVKSLPFPSKDEAKRAVCLEACKELYLSGYLSDLLLPEEKQEIPADVPTNYDEIKADILQYELYEMHVPAALRVPWAVSESSICLNLYFIRLVPSPSDREYADFGLFVRSCLPAEATTVHPVLCLDRGRNVEAELVPSGSIEFDQEEIKYAEEFQRMWLKLILDRDDVFSDFLELREGCSVQEQHLTFYLLLPVKKHDEDGRFDVNWEIVRGCLSSPVLQHPSTASPNCAHNNGTDYLKLANGNFSTSQVLNSVVVTTHNKVVYCIVEILYELNGYSLVKMENMPYIDHFKDSNITISRPEQPLLKAKQLFNLKNLLQKRPQSSSGKQKKMEYFIELPPEVCSLKIFKFSKEIASTLSLLPSLMHHVEDLLVAIELKSLFSSSFSQGSEISAQRVLEALTTERCSRSFSLERLETLGDAFLKYVVGRHLFLSCQSFDEGQLTGERSCIISNSHLHQLAIKKNLQVYIRDRWFDPCCFFALGRPCNIICKKGIEGTIHALEGNEVWCSKNHHWLHKKTIADVIEALVGAFLMDSGFRAAIAFLKWIGIRVEFRISDLDKIYVECAKNLSLAKFINIDDIEKLLGFKFVNKGLLLEALVHPSYSKHEGRSHRRLAFIGDAVLDYVITSYLFTVYRSMVPGDLTLLRSAAVNNTSFGHLAVLHSFHSFLLSDSDTLSEAINKFANYVKLPDHEKAMLQEPKCPKVLGDLVEACVGALLLDTGFNLNAVWRMVLGFMSPIIKFSCLQLNPVQELYELCQSKRFHLTFQCSTRGDGNVLVKAQVDMNGEVLTGSADGPNKKFTEKMASKDALLKLKVKGCTYETKLLKEIVYSGNNRSAQLIGYDGAAADDLIQIKNVDLLSTREIPSPSCERCDEVNRPRSLERPNSNKKIRNSGSTLTSDKASTKTQLISLCAKNGWDPPIFTCLMEGDIDKKFTFKVTLFLGGQAGTLVETFSEPQPKDAAEEHAAEGALWYLQHFCL